MPTFGPAVLADRALVAVSGADAVPFLDNIVTNAVDALAPGDARFAALLTPQGKIQFEFFICRTADGFLLDTHASGVADLLKRLTMYRLRAKVTFADIGRGVSVSPEPIAGGYVDPRDHTLGYRGLTPSLPAGDTHSYHRHRIALGIPESNRDYALGDTFPHEANYDLVAGVSFTKGCFVGQEVVARMQNKTVVRKRVVGVVGAGPLTSGAAVLLGEAEIGRIGSVDGNQGLALLRLDRAAEAAEKGITLMAAGVALTPAPAALARYRKSVAERPVIDL